MINRIRVWLAGNGNPTPRAGDWVYFNHYGDNWRVGWVAEDSVDSFGEVWLRIAFGESDFETTCRSATNVLLLEESMVEELLQAS